MFPKQQIDGYEKYWRRRKPGSSTALHYTSDGRIFFKWAREKFPDAITVHVLDEFIEWQQSLGPSSVSCLFHLLTAASVTPRYRTISTCFISPASSSRTPSARRSASCSRVSFFGCHVIHLS
jgi:hypothetical protein